MALLPPCAPREHRKRAKTALSLFWHEHPSRLNKLDDEMMGAWMRRVVSVFMQLPIEKVQELEELARDVNEAEAKQSDESSASRTGEAEEAPYEGACIEDAEHECSVSMLATMDQYINYWFSKSSWLTYTGIGCSIAVRRNTDGKTFDEWSCESLNMTKACWENHFALWMNTVFESRLLVRMPGEDESAQREGTPQNGAGNGEAEPPITQNVQFMQTNPISPFSNDALVTLARIVIGTMPEGSTESWLDNTTALPATPESEDTPESGDAGNVPGADESLLEDADSDSLESLVSSESIEHVTSVPAAVTVETNGVTNASEEQASSNLGAEAESASVHEDGEPKGKVDVDPGADGTPGGAGGHGGGSGHGRARGPGACACGMAGGHGGAGGHGRAACGGAGASGCAGAQGGNGHGVARACAHTGTKGVGADGQPKAGTAEAGGEAAAESSSTVMHLEATVLETATVAEKNSSGRSRQNRQPT
ncbi:hypothetical protein EWM64_g8227 [Hericium alpestre]|uniref:Uncharacterized protein n=1 Tax=Hericium alpestre TaxID=135208 RepID=A0A4Y9ZNE5_9AGAM|nr:hypothetical protein EWM64_g8227 [Hericium alpestre]